MPILEDRCDSIRSQIFSMSLVIRLWPFDGTQRINPGAKRWYRSRWEPSAALAQLLWLAIVNRDRLEEAAKPNFLSNILVLLPSLQFCAGRRVRVQLGFVGVLIGAAIQGSSFVGGVRKAKARPSPKLRWRKAQPLRVQSSHGCHASAAVKPASAAVPLLLRSSADASCLSSIPSRVCGLVYIGIGTLR
jgi:hypothetical protein